MSYIIKNNIAQKNCVAIFRVDKSLRFFENLNIYRSFKKVEKSSREARFVLILKQLVIRKLPVVFIFVYCHFSFGVQIVFTNSFVNIRFCILVFFDLYPKIFCTLKNLSFVFFKAFVFLSFVYLSFVFFSLYLLYLLYLSFVFLSFVSI